MGTTTGQKQRPHLILCFFLFFSSNKRCIFQWQWLNLYSNLHIFDQIPRDVARKSSWYIDSHLYVSTISLLTNHNNLSEDLHSKLTWRVWWYSFSGDIPRVAYACWIRHAPDFRIFKVGETVWRPNGKRWQTHTFPSWKNFSSIKVASYGY